MASQTYLSLPGGIKMPAVGIGTFLATNEDELEKALEVALEVGYRHIDTAFAYNNEKVVGRVVKKWIDKGKIKRDDLFITTKLPMLGVYPDKVEEYLKKSLENLQLDYVDLYLVHYPIAFRKLVSPSDFELEPKTDHIGVWKGMEAQVDAGRTKLIGLSNFSVSQIEHILGSARIKPANLQVEVHVLFQQRKLLEFCRKNDISVVAYAPLGSPGFIQLPGSQVAQAPDLLQNPAVKKIAEKHSKTVAQVLLKYLLQLGISVIPKSVSPNRVKENFDVFDFALDEDDVKKLAALDRGDKARIFTTTRFKGIENHPDYPHK